MKILVIGAGALGSLVGGVLSRSHDVTILGRPEQADVLNEKGLQITGLTEGEYRPNAVSDYPRGTTFDLIIICVKSYNTELVLDLISRDLSEGTYILSLQNGLDNEERIQRFLQSRSLPGKILGGITCHGVIYKQPGIVKHAGIGDTFIGPYLIGPDVELDVREANRIADLFTDAGIDVVKTEAIRREIWAKTIINSAINPLTAIVGKTNGVIIEDPEMRKLAGALVDEGALIAKAHGIEIGEKELLDRTLKVAERTKNNISSMLQDIRRKRRTEIESINGALYRRAVEKGIRAPYNHSMYTLVMSLQSEYLR